MAWDFETEPDFQKKLDWIDQFVREEIEPLDLLFGGSGAPYDKSNKVTQAILRPLQDEVRKRDLWACHLGPELGGKGYGQLKLALMNEILGRSAWAPTVFGSQAPDSGNAEILAHYGTEEQKARFLEPLLAGEIVSCYSMTEPQAGSDPREFKCRAWKEGREWVLLGEKWFSSNAPYAEFFIVMAVTNPDVPVHQGASMFLVPRDTPGIEVKRWVGLAGDPIGEGAHGYIFYNHVRVPEENLLGGEGQAFAIAQTRLGGGRVHHAMRTVGLLRRAFDMMCERALSRHTQGEVLARKQAVQHYIADSYAELTQFRLAVLYTAWLIDKGRKDDVRTHIHMVKFLTPKVLLDGIYRAVHVHGSLGVSNEMPLHHMWAQVPMMGIVDGPTEVHKTQLAKQLLKNYQPSPGLFPTSHLPPRVEAARRKFAKYLDMEVGNL
jgi:acyl-CoA dehydrogenase